jgi:hypothetical protein
MSPTQEQYNASIERTNAIGADGRLRQSSYVRAYWRELDTAIRAAEALASDASDAEVCRLWRRQIRTLKRLQETMRGLEGATRLAESNQN